MEKSEQRIGGLERMYVEARDEFHEAKLSGDTQGLRDHALALRFALDDTKDMSEDRYTALTQRLGFSSVYEAARSAHFDMTACKRIISWSQAECAYRILDAAIAQLRKGEQP